MTTALKTKRVQLGELIAFLREGQTMSRHNLADKTRSTVRDVERWERGELVPTTQEWQRMRGVFAQLLSPGSEYRKLFDAAAAEQKAIEDARQAAPTQSGGASDLDTAVRLLIEAMPGLRSMAIEVDDDGKVAVSYKTREVRIVEDSGHIDLRVR